MNSLATDRVTDNQEREPAWPDKVIERGLVFLLVVTPLAFGSVQNWSVAVMELTSFLLLAAWLVRRRDAPSAPGPGLRFDSPFAVLAACGAVLAAVALLQVVPLSGAVLDGLSPRTGDLYRAFLGDSPSWRTLSITPHETLSGIVLSLSYAALSFVVLQHYRSEERIRGLFRTIIIIGCSMAVVAVLTRAFRNGNVLWIFPVQNGENAMGPFINRNHFAGYMEMIIPVAMAYYLYTAGKIRLPEEVREASRVRRMFAFLDNTKFASLAQGMAAVLLLTGSLFISLSRGGILGYAVSMAVFAWMVRSRRSLRKRAVFMALLGGAVALAVVVASWSLFEARFELAGREASGRTGTWADAFSLSRDFPLLGAGWGSFGRVFPLYQSGHPDMRFEHAENEYVEVLTESGWPGLIALLGALAAGAVVVVRRWRDRHNRLVLCFTVGGCAAAVAIAVHSFFDFNMRVPSNAMLMTVIAALTCAALFKVPSGRKTKGTEG